LKIHITSIIVKTLPCENTAGLLLENLSNNLKQSQGIY